MLNGLLGYKRGMTQLFTDGGRLTAVTVLEVGPCKVVQIKTTEKDGYAAAQISLGEVRETRVSRPLRGHFKAADVPTARVLREFSGDLGDVTVGQTLTVDLFKKGERVCVTGISKGKGFQGVMKRHHFRGGPATHGSMFHRAPGSIGASSFPSRVWKNQRMPGHMGRDRITEAGLQIVEVRPEQNLIFVKGAVPGAVNDLVTIQRG
jgi:large subunit ribosomal protein L3